MKSIIYQHADVSTKQPAVTLEFPDVLPEDEVQSMEYEKICEEIHSILQHTAIEKVMSTDNLSENVPPKQEEPEESI